MTQLVQASFAVKSKVREQTTSSDWNSAPLLRGIFVGLVLLISHVYTIAAVFLVADLYYIRRDMVFTKSMALGIFGIMAVVSFEIASALFISTGGIAIPSAVIGVTVITYALAAGAGTRRNNGSRLLLGFVLTTASINLFSYFLGYQGSGAYFGTSQSLMGSFIGVDRRVFFVFSNGINAYGTLLGLMLVCSFVIFLGHRSVLALVCVGFCFLGIVLVDSRGAIACFLAACLLTFFFFGRWRLNILVVASVAAPVLLFLCSDLLTIAFPEMARAGTDISSGRFYYWSQIFTSFFSNSNFVPFGAGLNGTSSLPVNIASVPAFSNYIIEDGVLPGAHNMWLQLLVGGGMLKIFVYMAIFLHIGTSLRQIGSGAHLYLCSVFYYVLCVGVIESVLDYNRVEILFIVFFSVGLVHRSNFDRSIELQKVEYYR